MIEAGYAWKYDGGTKLTEDERFDLLEDRRESYARGPGLISDSVRSE